MSSAEKSNGSTASAIEVTSTNDGTMVSSQDNNQCTSQPIDMNNIQYTPELLSRYIHYYKTGQDINNPNISSTTNPSSDTPSTEQQQQPKKKKKKKKHQKLKHIPPLQLATRRTIQNCCKTSNLSLALITFYKALVDLIYIDGSVFYQLLNLCESGGSGSGSGDSSGDTRKKVHVGTPKNSKRDDKIQDVSTTANVCSSEITEATNDSKSSSIKITLLQRINHATTIHELLSSLQIPLIEQAYTALIRLSVRNNAYIKAEMYLKEAEGTQQCKVKLRLYSTLLRGYCGDIPSSSSSSDDDDSNDDISSKDEKQEKKCNNKPTKEGLIKALATWKRLYDNSGGMSTGHPNYAKLNSNNSNNSKLASADNGKSADSTSANEKDSNKNQKQQPQETISLFGEGISPKITLSEVEYTSLLKAATTLHDTKVIERVLSNVADEIQIPGRECRDAIVNWFRKDIDTKDKEKMEDDIAESQSALDEVTLPPNEVDLTSFNSVTNGSGWSIYDNCSIDTSTGQLTLANDTNSSSLKNDNEIHQTSPQVVYKLKPVELPTKSWKSMTNMNRTIVLNGSITGNVSKFQGGGKGKKRPRGGTNKGVSEVHGNNSNDRKSKSWTVKDNDSTTSTDEKKLNEKEEKKDKPQSNWRINAWNNFEKFIEEHPPYNVVIDGANVG